jgi:hypothetical protein
MITCAGNADEDDPEGPCKGIKVKMLKIFLNSAN